MKKLGLRITVLLLLCTTLITSCKDSDDFVTTPNDEIHLYIWRAMNTFYFWQESVPELAILLQVIMPIPLFKYSL